MDSFWIQQSGFAVHLLDWTPKACLMLCKWPFECNWVHWHMSISSIEILKDMKKGRINTLIPGWRSQLKILRSQAYTIICKIVQMFSDARMPHCLSIQQDKKHLAAPKVTPVVTNKPRTFSASVAHWHIARVRVFEYIGICSFLLWKEVREAHHGWNKGGQTEESLYNNIHVAGVAKVHEPA